MNPDSIRIVLVNPSHPGNIGAVARAMKNMGLRRLVLVEPRSFPHEEAEWRAASAADVLQEAVVTASVEEAIADCNFIIGTSARGRRIPWPTVEPRPCAEEVRGRVEAGAEVAFLFGREDRGLTNDELQLCNQHLHIPTHEDYTSLNLAMAVQIVAYELRIAALGERDEAGPFADWDCGFSTAQDLDRYMEHLQETLIEVGFLDPEAPRQLMPRLRRLYSRVTLDEMEVSILRGILTETQKALKARK